MKKIITLFFLLLVGFLIGTQKGGPLQTNPTFADFPDGTDAGSSTGDGTIGEGGCDGGGDGDNGSDSGCGCL